MRTRLLPGIALGLACFLPQPLPAATLAIAPSADTFIEGYGEENRNHGAEAILKIDQWQGRKTFLRFSLGTLAQGKHIERAILRLYVTDSGWNEAGELPDLATCVGLYDVVTPWTETGATFRTSDGVKVWSQGPGIGGPKYADVGPVPKPDVGVRLNRPIIPLDPRKVTKDSWMEIDVTDFVRQRIRGGDKEINLELESSDMGRNWTLASREAEKAEQRPQLAVAVGSATDCALKDVFLTDWKPGMKVVVPGNGMASLKGARWSFAAKAPGSKLAPSAIKPTATGAAFTPDAPGLYRVQASTGAGGVPETAEVYVLSLRARPRLYVTPERISALRAQLKNGGRIITAWKKWVDNGNAGIAQGKFYDMGPHDAAMNNALAYLVTGDRQYSANAASYAARVLAKRMPEQYGDSHAATFEGAFLVDAISAYYDWCHDQITPTQRRAIAEWLKYATRWCNARSGRPIAHNDGGARQLSLAAAPLALLGDDPDAPELLRISHDNFEHNLLPWLNSGGQGGRSGDGGEYEGLHGFFIVRYAWMTRTATGEDVFTSSPYFFNRIKHYLFGWYPRKLVERNGAYDMREYYSPGGDHTRLGYVGDTQPYQSAAALCDRFRSTPEAQGLRWLAGNWPTQWMQYCLKWAVLGDFESVPAKKPAELAYLDKGFNTMYARSDWSDDATWVLFENGPYVSVHQSLDKGGFEIFKGDLLASRTGCMDYANVQAPHTMNYLHRTISTNGLLIMDPQEKWKGFIGGQTGEQDGGGERTNWPITSSPNADEYLIYQPVFQRGEMQRFANRPELAYGCADLTDAYNNENFHGGTLNRAKVTNVKRQLLYLRGIDSVVVFDRVSSADPSFKKTFLLHSLGDLDVENGTETKVDDGEFTYQGATRAVIRYGWPKPVPSFARCLSVTLLPENAVITKIGGRTDLPPGQTEAFPGDQWHQQHRHHHIKDYWVQGKNYPPGDPPEVRWFGDPGSEWFVPGTPDETGGRGKWRIEVCPSTAEKDDVFFHVLCPRLGSQGPFPDVKRLPAGPFEGSLITENGKQSAAFFSRQETRQSAFSATLPAGKWLVVVSDMEPGRYTVGGRDVTVGADGLLVLADAEGAVKADRR